MRRSQAVPSVPIGFPFDLDDEQLGRAIAEMLEPVHWPGFEDSPIWDPELKIALLGAGLREGNGASRLRRPREPFASPTRRLSRSSSR